MLKIENLSFAFPDKELYDDVSFILDDGQKCAFIGASGSGKTTLADMILDTDKLVFDGKLIVETEQKIGYISQFYHLDHADQTTVFDYISSYFVSLQDEIAQICEEMATS